MPWFLLFIAGLMEAAWAVGLKYTDGFTRPLPSLLTILGIVISMGLLGLVARDLPIGTAYGVWVGIGALGAAVLGIFLFGETLAPLRFFFLTLLAVSIAGLKLTSA